MVWRGFLPVLLLVLSVPARADDTDQARALLREGNRLLEEGKAEKAIELYEAAYKLVPSAKILLNLGTAQRQLGRLLDAEATYRRYLDGPEAARKDEVNGHIAELVRQIPQVTIVSEPGARVTVDGKPVDAAAALRLDPGKHRFTAEKEGYQPTTLDVDLWPEERRTVTLGLLPVAAPPTSVPASLPVGVSPAPPPPPPPGRGQRIAGLVVAGGGAAVVGVGVALLVAASGRAARLEDDAASHAVWDARAADELEGLRAQGQLGAVLPGVGAAALVGGGVIYYLGRRAGREVSVVPAVDSEEAGLLFTVEY